MRAFLAPAGQPEGMRKNCPCFRQKSRRGRQGSPRRGKNRLQKGELILNYTENYHLPQWEPTDRVLRTDFNDAMSDIDDALKANADSVTELANRSRFTKLKEYSYASQMTKIEIDLSDIDWSQWDKVHIDGIPTNGSQMLIYFNEVVNQKHKLYLLGWSGIYMPRITFYVGNQPGRAVMASQGGTFVDDELTFSQLKKVIISGGHMPEGSYFSVWGEK